jgi:hypothetical protein
MSRKAIIVAAVLVLGLAAILIYNSDAMKNSRLVKALVARNIDARGGADVWAGVTSLRLSGDMDIGQDLVVPYTLEQKRPGKMCLEFEFDGAKSTQCTDGERGWKVAPFMGRDAPELMGDVEFRETADSADLYGLLYDYKNRGIDIDLAGRETIDGHDTYKLEIDLPRGGVRWLYLDVSSALEVKLEATRTVAGKQLRVDTFYHDWRPTAEGLLISRRQETSTEGDTISHFLTVDSVTVNPPIDDARFAPPANLKAASGGG